MFNEIWRVELSDKASMSMVARELDPSRLVLDESVVLRMRLIFICHMKWNQSRLMMCISTVDIRSMI